MPISVPHPPDLPLHLTLYNLNCCLQGDSWMRHFSAVRTTEIDQQLRAAVQDSPIRQMVLLGEQTATD
jgi:hypothetical protein